MFKKILDFIFEPEEELNEAQLETLLYLARKTYIDFFGHTFSEAKILAERQVQKWINEGKTTEALNRLWKYN